MKMSQSAVKHRVKLCFDKPRCLRVVAATYTDFVEEFKYAEVRGQCRYAVYDVQYQSSDGHVRNKIVFFMW